MNSPHPFGAWVERTQHHDTGATLSVRRSSVPKTVTDLELAARRSRRRSVFVPRQRRGD
jgi:hypothetical protein